MMNDQITYILDHTNRLSEFWIPRDAQMKRDRSLYNLEEPVKRQGFVDITLNDPKVLWDTVVSLLSSQLPRIRLPLSINFEQAEKDKRNKVERLLIGIFRELEDRQLKKGQHAWLRELAFWVCSGWVAVFPLIKDGKGIEFRADLYDPITVYPEWGENGLVRLARKYETTKAHARSMIASNDWKLSLEGGDKEDVSIVNYWEEDRDFIYNAVLIDEKVAKPVTKQDFPNIPVLIIPVGGSPVRAYTGGVDWSARIGESIIGSNRTTFEHLNKWVSMMMQIASDTAYPPIIEFTESGKGRLKIDDMGSGTIISRKLEERLELLRTAVTPVEVNTILAFLNIRKQHGGLPDIIYGGIPFELSGFAISQLLSAIRYKVAPYLAAMESVISSISAEFLRQFRAKKIKKLELRTMNPDRPQKGQFFLEEYNWKDIPESTFVEVEIPVVTPVDKIQQLLAARQALAPPQLLSRETLWEDFLQVQDSTMEYQRIIGDQINELPVMKMIATIEELKKKAGDARVEGNIPLADALNRYAMMLEMQIGMRQGIPTTPGQEAPPGIPPEMSPPEAGIAGVSPDRMRAMYGMSPPGLTRRPMTEEERAARRIELMRGGR